MGVEELSMDGLTVGQQLSAIIAEADRLVTSQHEVWATLQEELNAAGMHVVGYEPLEPEAEAWLDLHFREQIFPVLTPQAIDPAHPFPFIPNKGLSLIFELRKGRTTVGELIHGAAHPAPIHQATGAAGRYIALETLIRREDRISVPEIPGAARRRVPDHPRQRHRGRGGSGRPGSLLPHRHQAAPSRAASWRLELEPDTPDSLVGVVLEGLDANTALISQTRGFLGMDDLSQLVEEDRPDLKFPPFNPRFPERVREHGGVASLRSGRRTCWSTTPTKASRWWWNSSSRRRRPGRHRDQADTLPRGQTVRDHQGADRRCGGGQVGDRRDRAQGAFRRRAESDVGQRAGARGRAGRLRLHRLEDTRQGFNGHSERRRASTYCHFGTGNYHPVTARIYTDLSYFTADPKTAAMRRSCSTTSPAISSRAI